MTEAARRLTDAPVGVRHLLEVLAIAGFVWGRSWFLSAFFLLPQSGDDHAVRTSNAAATTVG